MVTAYIIILLLSTALTAWAALRVMHRLGALFNLSDLVPAGLLAVVATLAFLTVVGAPAKLLVGAVLLVGLGLISNQRFLPKIALWGVPFIAVMLGLSTLTLPIIDKVPHAMLLTSAGVAWLAMVLGSHAGMNDVKTGSIAHIVALLPLIASPFIFQTPSHVGLDAALIAAGLVGLLAAFRPGDVLGMARAPLALLLGWLMLEAASHGAWIAAIVSLLAWGGAIAYATQQNQPSGSDAFRL